MNEIRQKLKKKKIFCRILMEILSQKEEKKKLVLKKICQARKSIEEKKPKTKPKLIHGEITRNMENLVIHLTSFLVNMNLREKL